MRPPYNDTGKLGFGVYFTDNFFAMKYNVESGWHDGKITKRENIRLDPAACVLHYAQEIFEGMRAYVSPDGRVLLFRPEENARRMNKSAIRMCMPELPEEVFVKAVSDLVMREKEWIPRDAGTSLYIRPTMIGSDSFLDVKPAKEYLFYILLSPVSTYNKEGFNPIGILVEDEMARAVNGGIGEAKTGGNYAASLLAGKKAMEKGFSHVLYLDAKEHRYVEEVGSMNVFFVQGNKLFTPPLSGSILPGITRKSVITLARDLGYEVKECFNAIEDILEDIKNGLITEMFGTGTAAVITPVGTLHYRGNDYIINHKQTGEVTSRLYNYLVDIQYGRRKDIYEWVKEIGRI